MTIVIRQSRDDEIAYVCSPTTTLEQAARLALAMRNGPYLFYLSLYDRKQRNPNNGPRNRGGTKCRKQKRG